MTKLVNEEEIIKETQLDFEPKLSKWLIKQGFKRELDKYSSPEKYIYCHKELPINIKPIKSDNCWFGDYNITFIESIYANVLGKAQLSLLRNGREEETEQVLNGVIDKMNKSFELAKKIVKKINKGDYL